MSNLYAQNKSPFNSLLINFCLGFPSPETRKEKRIRKKEKENYTHSQNKSPFVLHAAIAVGRYMLEARACIKPEVSDL